MNFKFVQFVGIFGKKIRRTRFDVLRVMRL